MRVAIRLFAIMLFLIAVVAHVRGDGDAAFFIGLAIWCWLMSEPEKGGAA